MPSPDWFVGLDSLELCKSGHFLDTVTVEADPIDAGTDNGFTFTSPNWPTEPKASMFRITNQYPSHPAGSFFYPDKTALPTIATFTLIKDKEYELSKEFQISGNDVKIAMSAVNKFSKEIESNHTPTDIPSKKQPTVGYHASSGPTDFVKKRYSSGILEVCV